MVGSTTADVRPPQQGPPPQWGRRTVTAVLVVIVLLGAAGVFGVHSRTVHASGGGYRLTVTYPQTARAGLDVPWRARVHHDGGLPAQIVLAVSQPYFRIFETQGFYPDADQVRADTHFVYFTFDTTGGEDFVLDYDAYIQPGSQVGKSATVRLIVNGRTVVEVSLRTWLVP